MTAMPISMDGSDPATWDGKLDGVLAAPGNHQVIYEDDSIRVVSVTIRPGEKEPVHHHRLPAVFVIDRLVKLRDFDAGGREIPLPIPDKFDLPLIVKFPPQPAHAVHNEDTATFHATRIEFKRGFPS